MSLGVSDLFPAAQGLVLAARRLRIFGVRRRGEGRKVDWNRKDRVPEGRNRLHYLVGRSNLKFLTLT